MTVFDELTKVYDRNAQSAGEFINDERFTLLPLGHVSVKIPIEVVVDQDGSFLSARGVPKDEQLTVIPATIDAATRSSGVQAFPLQDKIKYCAGDYIEYVKGKKDLKNAAESHAQYLRLLQGWAADPDVPSQIIAIASYIGKNQLVHDLLGSLTNQKLVASVKNGDSFVRFTVDDATSEPVWRNNTIFQSWTKYYLAKQAEDEETVGIDYITGTEVPTTKKLEKNVDPFASGAKLISANDDSSYTYRGVFLGDDYYSLGFQQSQKMTHALKWLIQRQGIHRDTRAYLFWTSGASNDSVNDAISLMANGQTLSARRQRINAASSSVSQTPDTGKPVAIEYSKRLLGMAGDIETDAEHPVNILFLDAATTGRMSIVYYDLMQSDELKQNLINWSRKAVFTRYWDQTAHQITPNFYQIVEGAYGIGKTGSRYETVQKRAMTHLLVAVIHGRVIPPDIIQAFYRHVRHPNSYHDDAMRKTTAMQAWYRDIVFFTAIQNYNTKGASGMSLEKENTDRSYLYGRLLAVADTVERSAIRQQQARGGSQTDRLTTAVRFFTNFSERPASTWKRIWLAVVRSYLGRLSAGSQAYYAELVKEITNMMPSEEFADDSPLSPVFLSGYAAQSEDNRYKKDEKGETSNDK
ncbi:type I-C CRISPR-associated protein Cas8c/Csd1 [Schleiferilactobacillus shenzhenensis]|uniref:Uncharacterized protein n=1 Tax=Schleiferilactobacillus shenzhenensis LY-73 TaxID=1231336 RepID=U4TSD5_9LACO|nr:type I-C CRISPR-associated protein Cas8c/Csd1 [Schleiferilactobacillus shenzhenensis]ERL66330.1 hypothetical protein L248_0009 [Schleiferilactobacillus shenzhenensis LY-73]